MLKMKSIAQSSASNYLRSFLGSALSLLVAVTLLVGCGSSSRAQPEPATMTPIEPTATISVTPTQVATPVTEPVAQEHTMVATSTEYVQAQVNVPMLAAPDAGAAEIGMIADGQVALVTGASADGAWWRVICPDDSIGDCWVSADLAMTLPTTAP